MHTPISLEAPLGNPEVITIQDSPTTANPQMVPNHHLQVMSTSPEDSTEIFYDATLQQSTLLHRTTQAPYQTLKSRQASEVPVPDSRDSRTPPVVLYQRTDTVGVITQANNDCSNYASADALVQSENGGLSSCLSSGTAAAIYPGSSGFSLPSGTATTTTNQHNTTNGGSSSDAAIVSYGPQQYDPPDDQSDTRMVKRRATFVSCSQSHSTMRFQKAPDTPKKVSLRMEVAGRDAELDHLRSELQHIQGMANAELHNQRASFGNVCEQYAVMAREIQRAEAAQLREQEVLQLNQREALLMDLKNELMNQSQSSAQMHNMEQELEFPFYAND